MDKESENLLLEELKELRAVMGEVRGYWKRQSSLRWNFFRGIIYGLGFFIGSALLTAGLIYILTHLVDANTYSGRVIEKIVDQVDKVKP